ncbi:uncharacterized protein BDZ99DRAFT_468932 [Mytilinidion resinicola]|uniref:Uncharacterized protein n=1 Tax=Mytilinidion resinicola TaxID=574789 RepID=A0A6A6Y1U4_9PEZI|nr:uncharacterized protein BDZ99DRAFT_468932 [Mytilinidion resinicola]KAF2802483.1 hypothetical protein BDZ99DRAFT_468932 [Mytilinidion resinicola]
MPSYGLHQHLAYGRGLPPGVFVFALTGFIISALFAVIRIAAEGKKWTEQIPSGIAIGIGIYILPMYTIPQVLGGLAHYLCKKIFRTGELSVITIAVGLVLGQSLVNIITLLLGLTSIPRS